jgi:hypothetical protein
VRKRGRCARDHELTLKLRLNYVVVALKEHEERAQTKDHNLLVNVIEHGKQMLCLLRETKKVE